MSTVYHSKHLTKIKHTEKRPDNKKVNFKPRGSRGIHGTKSNDEEHINKLRQQIEMNFI